MIKFCKKCGLEKPVDEFTFRSKATGTRRPECRKCTQLYQVKGRKEVKLKAKYNMRMSGWLALYEFQDGKCGICSRETELHVDHDHENNQIRSLLCPRCNMALGLLKEDPEIINKLLQYAIECQNLKRYRQALAESKERT